MAESFGLPLVLFTGKYVFPVPWCLEILMHQKGSRDFQQQAGHCVLPHSLQLCVLHTSLIQIRAKPARHSYSCPCAGNSYPHSNQSALQETMDNAAGIRSVHVAPKHNPTFFRCNLSTVRIPKFDEILEPACFRLVFGCLTVRKDRRRR